ncbi:MAG: hypothetical protein ETSY1_15080 [Candidatus Entotheonella factor]|uniref:Methyltransferase small domain-containing protein n=1 Tax=Entotheonella factor TaxID=1429438 RepID=W4LN71_ENTF1|nr:MAG: hypothetical protein ETSY1_15080 [Candidatus Entotheonella factor]
MLKGTIPLEETVRVNPYIRIISLAWFKLKRPFLLHRVRHPALEYIDAVPMLSLPDVLNPVVFRGGSLMARTVANSPLAAPSSTGAPRALDMGTGAGAGAIFAARRGYQVVGVDLNPEAVRCARLNVILNNLEDHVDIRHGDLFAPVEGERFSLVLFNPPFFRGKPKDLLDLAWRGTDVLERFATELPSVLEPEGKALILLSTDGDAAGMLQALHANHLIVEPVIRKHFGNEIMTIYSARRPSTAAA